MANHLRIWIEVDDDSTGELYVSFEAHKFSGQSSAWFDLSKLKEEAKKFAQYPLAAEHLPCIEGGYWSKDATKIEQEHLHISAYPTSPRGNVGLLVRTAVPRDDQNRPGLHCSASIEFKASYEQLAEFSKNLISLANGDITEFVFNEIV